MKILYAIQGTGNGHLARAIDVVPELQRHGKVDLIVSGAQADIQLPFSIKYQSKGLSFYFGKNGGINFWKTVHQNNLIHLSREVDSFPIENYDLVVNDFEPISAWAAKKKDVPLVALGHQAAFFSKKTPRPSPQDPFAEWLFRKYAPAKRYVGFHFKSYDKNIFTPVVRQSIYNARPINKGHYTVYLPAYDDKKLVKLLGRFKNIRWQIFSKHAKSAYTVGQMEVFPVHSESFIKSMVSAAGVICGAGFETPAEALHLNKKLMVVPMKHQYEQKCNALALKKLGVYRVKRLKKSSAKKIEKWLDEVKPLELTFPNITREAVASALHKVIA